MRKLLLSAVALLALSAQSAFAINLTFQFDVNSSGPSMYACNAGIKHKQQTKVCYDKESGATCTPGCAAGNTSQCAENTSPASCACTGEDGTNGNQGGSYMDFASVTYGDWVDNGDVFVTKENKKLSGGFGYDWASLSPMDKPVYNQQIKDLTFNLGSEIYGAEYFVDICYRGSQIDYRGVKDLNFNLVSKVTVTNLKATTNSYQELSGLSVKSETRCIMQDAFNYCDSDKLPIDLCGTNANYNNYTLIASKEISLVGKAAQQQELYNLGTIAGYATPTVAAPAGPNTPAVVADQKRAPKFCYTRYSFTEAALNKIRKWKAQKARICTYTEISEPKNN